MNEAFLALKESYLVSLNTCQKSYCTSVVGRYLPGAELWELEKERMHEKQTGIFTRSFLLIFPEPTSNPRKLLNSALSYVLI